MKKNRLRQLLAQKHYMDKVAIRSLSSGLRDSFDRAYDIAKSSITAGIKESGDRYAMLNEKLKEIEIPEDGPPSEEAQDMFDELGQAMYAIDLDTDALLSLEEMRVIFIYKTLEKAVREMIGVAFPRVNKKDLFRWETVKSTLSFYDINITHIDGYQEVNQLRVVNNNIKHTIELNEETKKIPYWKDELEFSPENLSMFYEVVKDQVAVFAESLGQAIISSVYEPDAAKVEKFADEMADKLGNKELSLLIKALNDKLVQRGG